MTDNNKVGLKKDVLISRRQLLGLGAGLGLMAIPGLSSLAKSSAQKKVGLQLYTLRDLMAKSVPETLKLAASVGYREVEFAGYFDHKPKVLREILDSEGLTAPSTHAPLESLQKDFESLIEAAQILGHRYIVVPYLNDEQRGTGIDTYKRLAEQFNILGERCSKAGLKFAYHNHAFEFDKVDDQVPYHVILAETDPQHVYMELDLYWIAKAGKDPLDYFRKHPGRFRLWHVKDMDENGNFADVGQGVIDFRRIFAAADIAGLEHGFVERDHTDDPISTIRQGYEGMKQLASHTNGTKLS
ncbi:sugar phosphate isomerase/epimerase family protein [Microbulbifer rhizosphaerae]|uniref:Sugar phosphate isomerase/epimerase n=1 Tax=Microbulbifer rhizosphaerae TaxID=1562603 RepID=A0A7W4WE06_9GAMM|nr:sugar phosphate isomerase/epimerase [Microbulbifer rhizosphaerae]MBB3062510.1 sugar phosphate isomerase/epimerase [Microbulbifer rhizosphaerae]